MAVGLCLGINRDKAHICHCGAIVDPSDGIEMCALLFFKSFYFIFIPLGVKILRVKSKVISTTKS